MGDKLKYERFFWFHNHMKAGQYPNAKHLAEKFEMSSRTAQRDIEFMRDRLKAPLEYHPEKRGYFYTNDSYEIPSQWYSKEAAVALALAVRLASTIPDKEIKYQLCGFIQKIFNIHNSRKLNLHEISKKISVKNIEYSKVNEKCFHVIVSALFRETPLSMSYHSPHTNKNTNRTILPLHLIHYMGSWHIVAFCALRNDLRDFALSRIKFVAETAEAVNLPDNLPSIKEYTRKNFGIIQGGRTKIICLEFSPSVSEWMQEQVWHPEQEVILKKDGSLKMRFPVADFRELKRRILSYGSEVKVISPKALALEVKEEIERMGGIYGRG
ncbi:MAG TPA: WYL domain-containing protein [Nitrospirae bacterium]|nr:WYL domain-containing protein [Nitrospirota bacterium]HDZ00561.1 WYL domain-containing protein [Nitrospirota bacterium]